MPKEQDPPVGQNLDTEAEPYRMPLCTDFITGRNCLAEKRDLRHDKKER